VLAMRACAEAAAEVGLCIGTKTAGSMVLLPAVEVTRSLLRCLSPGMGRPAFPSGESGSGVAAELMSRGADGLAISVVSSTQGRGEAFISALRARLLRFAGSSNRGQSEVQGATLQHRRSSVYLLVSRLLCDTTEAPGSFVAEFVHGFSDRYMDHNQSPSSGSAGSRPRCGDGGSSISITAVGDCLIATEELRGLVEEVLGKMQNYSCPVFLEEVGPLLQPTVERCLFARMGPMLWRHYATKLRERDGRFLRKTRALGDVSDKALLEALEVKPALYGGSTPSSSPKAKGKAEAHLDTSQGAMKRSSSWAFRDSARGDAAETGGTGESELLCDVVVPSHPYERAAASLQQVEAALQRGSTPQNGLEALLNSQLEMKACALEASCGRAELSSMDDTLPLFVFLLLRSQVRCPLACASFLQDSLTSDQRMDSEGRAVLLLESAATYIADEWDITELLGGGPSAEVVQG